MSILIKGMEMPAEGEAVVLVISNENGKTLAEVDEYCGAVYEPVPVPPHGRLIDADEKIRVQIYDDMFEDYRIVEMTIDALLHQGWIEATAPTIIPAEEDEA